MASGATPFIAITVTRSLRVQPFRQSTLALIDRAGTQRAHANPNHESTLAAGSAVEELAEACWQETSQTRVSETMLSVAETVAGSWSNRRCAIVQGFDTRTNFQ